MMLDWNELMAQRRTPETKAHARQLTQKLESSPLANLGSDYVMSRLPAAAYYSALVFPHGADNHFAFAMAYFIGWVFGLDEIMDNCPNIGYLEDLQQLLRRQSDAPIDARLDTDNLKFDPYCPIDTLDLTLLDFVVALQTLRQLLIHHAATDDGLELFDQSLQTQVIPAMMTEARWRLGLESDPDYDTYLENGHYSICGIISVDLINAFLPTPHWNRQVADVAIHALGYATRLFNDISTRSRDEDEGRPNAIHLLKPTRDNNIDATIDAVTTRMEHFCHQIERLCWPHIQTTPKGDTLHFLHHYIFYCAVVSRAMYTQGDFVSEIQ